MQITIKDIAKEAHVSFATVSRAFNGVYGVRPSTRKRILAIAERLNYTPNGIARGLVRKQTKTIGLVLPDITKEYKTKVLFWMVKQFGTEVNLANVEWDEVYFAEISRRGMSGTTSHPGGAYRLAGMEETEE